MYKTKIELADHVITVYSMYKETVSFMETYRIEPNSQLAKKTEFNVVITPKDIEFERQKSAAEDRRKGISIRHFTDQYLETLAVYRQIAEQMIDRDILLFHGSVIAVDGEGFLFTAKSGTGKSTHTRLWREVLGERAIMVNDDKPLISIPLNSMKSQNNASEKIPMVEQCPSKEWKVQKKVMVYGTPWDGKHHLSNNVSVPLKGIAILKRCDETFPENTIEKISKRQAYAMLLQQSYRSKDAVRMGKVVGMVDKLAGQVSLYEMHCNMEPEAAIMAYETMSK